MDVNKCSVKSSNFVTDERCLNAETNDVPCVDISVNRELHKSLVNSSDFVQSGKSYSLNMSSDFSPSYLDTRVTSAERQPVDHLVTNSSDVAHDDLNASLQAASDFDERTGIQRRELHSKTKALIKKCAEHDEPIKMFCLQHDEVCCSDCIALHHRKCDDVLFIPKLKKNVLEEVKQGDVKTTMESLFGELQAVKQQKTEELLAAEKDMNDDLEELKKFKDQLVTKIEELETNSIHVVKERRNKTSSELTDDIAMIQDIIKSTKDRLKLTTQGGKGREPSTSAFVNCKISEKHIKETEAVLRKMKSRKTEIMKFYFNKSLQTCLDDYESFGDLHIVETDNAATPLSTHNLMTWRDHSQPEIFGLCVIGKGIVLATDIANSKIKRLDQSCKVMDNLLISGKPYGICNTRENEVAVTVLSEMRVQFISVSPSYSMKQTGSFKVGVRCRGICYSRNELFVSCGGSITLDDKEGPGHIRVYDMSGNLMRKIERNELDEQMLGVPRHLITSTDGACLYVTDNSKGLLLFTRDGTFKKILNEKIVKQPYGLCLGEGNRIFVCSYDNHTAYHMDNYGKILSEALGRADSLYRPRAIQYCPDTRKLFIAVDRIGVHLVVFNMVTETEV